MMWDVCMEGKGGELQPVEALVVFDAGGRHICVRHHVARVREDESVEFSGATPMSAQALGRWAAAWRRRDRSRQNGRWLDPRVLYESHWLTVWWRPPQRTRMWFHVAGTDEAEGLRVEAPWPGLVFALETGGRLSVVAVEGNARPHRESPLFRAPFPNVDDRGSVCLGSARGGSVWTAVEEAFVESAFSHLLGGGPPLEGKQSYPQVVGFYRSLARRGRKTFPAKVLLPLHITLEAWVKERDR